jgi:hypothetical protein
MECFKTLSANGKCPTISILCSFVLSDVEG